MRTQFSKIALTAFAVNSALSMAFAGIPANCTEEIITLSKDSGFDMQTFTTNLPVAVAKAKLQAKAPFGQPKDSDKTDIGITFGCLKVFPESPVEIASLLKDISQKAASGTIAAMPAQVQPQNQPQLSSDQWRQLQKLIVQGSVKAPPQEQPQSQFQSPPPDQWKKVQKLIIQNLIEDGVEKNKREIQMESVYLSPDDIDDLYEKNKKGAGVSALLGGTIGFGIGSYMQGNIAIGITQSILDVFSYINIIADTDMFRNEPAIIIITQVVSRITGAVAPFVYQSNYNDALRSALRRNSLSYSIDPLIIPKDGAPAVGLAFNLRY